MSKQSVKLSHLGSDEQEAIDGLLATFQNVSTLVSQSQACLSSLGVKRNKESANINSMYDALIESLVECKERALEEVQDLFSKTKFSLEAQLRGLLEERRRLSDVQKKVTAYSQKIEWRDAKRRIKILKITQECQETVDEALDSMGDIVVGCKWTPNYKKHVSEIENVIDNVITEQESTVCVEQVLHRIKYNENGGEDSNPEDSIKSDELFVQEECEGKEVKKTRRQSILLSSSDDDDEEENTANIESSAANSRDKKTTSSVTQLQEYRSVPIKRKKKRAKSGLGLANSKSAHDNDSKLESEELEDEVEDERVYEWKKSVQVLKFGEKGVSRGVELSKENTVAHKINSSLLGDLEYAMVLDSLMTKNGVFTYRITANNDNNIIIGIAKRSPYGDFDTKRFFGIGLCDQKIEHGRYSHKKVLTQQWRGKPVDMKVDLDEGMLSFVSSHKAKKKVVDKSKITSKLEEIKTDFRTSSLKLLTKQEQEEVDEHNKRASSIIEMKISSVYEWIPIVKFDLKGSKASVSRIPNECFGQVKSLVSCEFTKS